MSNFSQRVLTGLVGAAIAVALCWVGGWAFSAFIAVLAVGAQFELYGLLRAGGTKPLIGLGLVMGAVAALWPVLAGSGLMLAAGLLALLPTVLFLRRTTPLLDAAGTAFGVLYPGLLASSIVLLRTHDGYGLGDRERFWLTVAVLFSVFAADSFAYLAGRALGRTALFPRISPNKTWEGALGGALGAFGMVALFKVFALGGAISWVDTAAIAVASGLIGPFGDLTESLFKRSVGVKDSATWLPGHGGLLDRVDAMVIVVPVVALYLHMTRGLW